MRWLLAASLALSFWGCEEDEAETRLAAADAATDEPQVVIQNVRGNVESLRHGEWLPAEVGESLGVDASIRTERSAEATLAVGAAGDEVILKEASEVSIREVSREVARVRLERGRLGASLEGKIRLKVESRGSTAVAEATTGQFSVFNNGKGLVAVAAETAEVQLKTTRGVEQLEAGTQATVVNDAPKQRLEIPKEVFLSVVWPAQKLTRDKTTMLAGKVDPGSEVSINGKPAAVNADGSFTAVVPLADGRNALEVRATDALGRSKESRQSVEVRRHGPKVRADSDGIWK